MDGRREDESDVSKIIQKENESCMKVKMTRQEWNELRVLNKLHFLFAL